MSDVILETQSLTKEFKGFTAVSNVNLAVRRGSIHALIGPNGAGKTTCFNLLTKFLVPTSGVIRFNGNDITAEAPAQIARRGRDLANTPHRLAERFEMGRDRIRPRCLDDREHADAKIPGALGRLECRARER